LESLLQGGVEKGKLSWVQLLKAIKLIEEQFSDDEVAKIVQILTEAISCADADAVSHRLSLGMETFKDKSGNSHEREKWRMISVFFGPRVVSAYKGMLRGLLNTVLSSAPDLDGSSVAMADVAAAPRRAAVICCTPDLLNSIRTGLPPVIPSYSRSLLWRGEHACLQQVADAEEVRM
jgi:hypothetical protein